MSSRSNFKTVNPTTGRPIERNGPTHEAQFRQKNLTFDGELTKKGQKILQKRRKK